MRSIIFTSLLILCISCTSSKKALTASNKLNGTWVPIKQEFGGTLLPTAAFEKQNLIIADSVYTFTAESVDKGVVKYRDDKMDIYGKEGVNAGKHFTAIYKVEQTGSSKESERLTICYNLTGDHYPETFETKGKRTYFLSVYKRSP